MITTGAVMGWHQLRDWIQQKPFTCVDTWTAASGSLHHGPLTRYVKLQVAHAPGMPGTFSPAADFKWNRWLAIPACITARAWRTCCDACRDRSPAVTGKTFPAFPAHAQPAILRIWQEAHDARHGLSTHFSNVAPKPWYPSFTTSSGTTRKLHISKCKLCFEAGTAESM